jgi:ligand-binding SRPBCC domain-containing protein
VPSYQRKQCQLYIARPREAIFAYLADARHHSRLHPSETLLGEPNPALSQGIQQTIEFELNGRKLTQTREISQWLEPERIVLTQISGPYTRWKHQCLLDSFQEGTLMTDVIEYEVPAGLLKRRNETLYEQYLETLLKARQQEAKRILEFIGRIRSDN